MRSISGILSRRDWIYLLSLLVPLVNYNLILKLVRISSAYGGAGPVDVLGLIKSDLFFNLGLVALWIGLFVLARGNFFRWPVVVLFHLTSIIVAIITTTSYTYFKITGSTFDYNIIAYAFQKPAEVKEIVGSSFSPVLVILVAFVLLYAVLGPWLITKFVERRQGAREPASLPEAVWPVATGLLLVAGGFILLSPYSGEQAGASRSFSRDPVVNVVVSEIDYREFQDTIQAAKKSAPVEKPPTNTKLEKTPDTQKKNIVFIHLESTRARSVTPYNEDIDTTPFLDELAKKSLVAERAYTVVPHTSKALTAINCGIPPHLVREVTEAQPNGVPSKCLPQLLKEQGYNTVAFQSATAKFENRADLLKNFGYDKFYPLETMNTKGFQRSNYFGYEDDIMLDPSEKWLKEHKDEPFVALNVGVTGHHDYQPIDRYGQKKFSDDPVLNGYLNEIHYLDFYVKNLIDQYKKLGLYDNTIFVIYGDHGEGFGEHDLYQHDNTIYQEGLRIPLIIHDPGRFENGKRVQTLTDQLDILPTLVDLLGYKVTGGEYPGRSMLAPPEKDRTLFFSCFYDYKCLASLQGDKKYIYFYGNQPDQVFDLSSDPLEQHNIAGEQSKEYLDERRSGVLEWYSRVNAMYERKRSG